VLERANRVEGAWLRERMPPTPPPRRLVVAALAARGGLLWWLVAAGLMARPGRMRRAGTRGAIALGTTIAVSHLVAKAVTPRRRPEAHDSPAREGQPERPSSSSFPSAHAAAATAFTVAVGCEEPLLGAAIAPLAAAVSYSRVRTLLHWPSDVVAGALLGGLTALLTRRVTQPR
jgi:membrane-associated phospholipid phosphatase